MRAHRELARMFVVMYQQRRPLAWFRQKKPLLPACARCGLPSSCWMWIMPYRAGFRSQIAVKGRDDCLMSAKEARKRA